MPEVAVGAGAANKTQTLPSEGLLSIGGMDQKPCEKCQPKVFLRGRASQRK